MTSIRRSFLNTHTFDNDTRSRATNLLSPFFNRTVNSRLLRPFTLTFIFGLRKGTSIHNTQRMRRVAQQGQRLHNRTHTFKTSQIFNSLSRRTLTFIGRTTSTFSHQTFTRKSFQNIGGHNTIRTGVRRNYLRTQRGPCGLTFVSITSSPTLLHTFSVGLLRGAIFGRHRTQFRQHSISRGLFARNEISFERIRSGNHV